MEKGSLVEEKCPACLNESFEKLIDFGSVPQSGFFLSSHAQKRRMTSLSFEYCLNCAFIRQKLPESLHDYANDSKKTGHTIPPYSSEIAEHLHEKQIRNNELIVEIGSNDGSFLDMLSKSGFTNLLGVEPSLFCSDISRAKGYRTESVYFNTDESSRIREKYGPAGAIVCRHILEHIPNVPDFVVSARRLLKEKGTLFIETPYSNDLIHGLRADELWDQHLSYFTPSNLEMLVVNNGFAVDNVLIRPYIGEKTILLWGSVSQKIRPPQKSCQSDADACRNFAENWHSFCRRITEKIVSSKKPVFCLGASHPQTNFLVFSEVGNHVSKLIDDDPYKAGKYICVPNPIPIVTTRNFLKSNPSGTIVHAAFGYDSWMERIKNSLKKRIDIIKPFDFY